MILNIFRTVDTSADTLFVSYKRLSSAAYWKSGNLGLVPNTENTNFLLKLFNFL